MLTRAIPSSGEALPLIGLGTYRAFDADASAAEGAALAEVLKTLVAHGGRMLDSSPMYGRAEGVLGDLQAQLGLRPQLFLATKVWTTGRDAGIRQMQRSFQSRPEHMLSNAMAGDGRLPDESIRIRMVRHVENL